MKNQDILINEEETVKENKQVYTPALALMIIGLIFSIILPIVTYPCSIISLVFSVTKRKEYKTEYAIILNILALVIALANSTLGVLNNLGVINLY